MESDLITQDLPLKKSDEDLDAEFDQLNADVEEVLARTQRSFNSRSRRHVNLYEAPEFVKRLNAFEEVTAGDTVAFQCQWRAFPKPTIKWYKDDQEVTEDARYDAEADDSNQGIVRLVLNGALKSDEGAYKCKAENQEGVASTTGYLSVTGGSSIEEKTLAAREKKERREQRKIKKKLEEQKQARNNNSSSDSDDSDGSGSSSSSSDSSARKAQSSDSKVSYPPHLRTIVEQKSLEEREAESVENQPPSPIQDFIEKMQSGRGRGATWPYSVMGYGPNQKDEDAQSNSSDTSVESQVELERVAFDATTADDDDVFTSSDPDDVQHNNVTSSTPELQQQNGDHVVPVKVPVAANAPPPKRISTTEKPSSPQGSPSRGSTARPIICSNAVRLPDIKITPTPAETVDMAPVVNTVGNSSAAVSKSNEKRKSTENIKINGAKHRNDRVTESYPDVLDSLLDLADSPWLYFLPVTSSMTFVASATQMNPLFVVLIMVVISLVAFQFLLAGREMKPAR